MSRKLLEIVLVYTAMMILFAGCAAYQPTAYGIAPLKDGEVLNLYDGFSKWIAVEGDAMVRSFHNSATGITIHARPWYDGWAIACTECNEIKGFFVNVRTYKDFMAWATGSGGFVEIARNLPLIQMPTLIVMPVVLPAGYQEGDDLHAWDLMPCLGSMCSESDSRGFDNEWSSGYLGFSDSDDDGFVEESEVWEVETVELP